MRKSNKQIIYEACELIETGPGEFSCLSIDEIIFEKGTEKTSGLTKRYAKFYGKDYGDTWGFDFHCVESGKQERIIALLLFAEVEL